MNFWKYKRKQKSKTQSHSAGPHCVPWSQHCWPGPQAISVYRCTKPAQPWGLRGGFGQGGAARFSLKRWVDDRGAEAAVRQRSETMGEFWWSVTRATSSCNMIGSREMWGGRRQRAMIVGGWELTKGGNRRRLHFRRRRCASGGQPWTGGKGGRSGARGMRGKEKGRGKGGAAAIGGTLLKRSGENRGRRGRSGVSVCVEEREGRRGAWRGDG
jgi:hypothetical protein